MIAPLVIEMAATAARARPASSTWPCGAGRRPGAASSRSERASDGPAARTVKDWSDIWTLLGGLGWTGSEPAAAPRAAGDRVLRRSVADNRTRSGESPPASRLDFLVCPTDNYG